MAEIARRYDYEFHIIEAVLRVNDDIKERMVTKVENALGGVAGKTIALLGLAFKPETDDMRDSPTIPLVEGLHRLESRVPSRGLGHRRLHEARPRRPRRYGR